MDAEILQGFIRQAEEYLPLVRGGILVCAQSGSVYGELSASLRQIASIRRAASILELDRIETACAEFESDLKSLGNGTGGAAPLADEDARRLLDKLSALEVLTAKLYFSAGDFPDSVSNFVEESFGRFEPSYDGETIFETTAADAEEFEIDEEMLEVFALEADELLTNFSCRLKSLNERPDDREALAEMRRVAHTLKGSAGVVGMRTLPRLAHRVEDLLDFWTDETCAGNEKIFELLLTATDCFQSLATGDASAQLTKKIARIERTVDEIAACQKTKKLANQTNAASQPKSAETKSEDRAENSKPIVRVSLERLDELIAIADDLNANRARLERRFAEQNPSENRRLETLFANQNRLLEEMQNRLLRLRLVRFGSLAGRLQRTVRAACEEEQKRAELFIEGENLELDTQILDGFVEPLLHLLRNAVAHGVEAPDLRRLLGKPETGAIFLRARRENEQFVVTVSDDGRGISADALREKAVANGFVNRSQAELMTDNEAFELIFLHGLTTAENLNQTAGRGVGMNIVKRNVERQRGAISIASEARKGTTFTVRLPTTQTPSTEAKSLSVLIVDDSPSVRRATAGLIKSAGWQPQIAEDGLAALEILRGARSLPDIILTDAEMPRMDGYALASVLKSQASLQSIPVVMITSRADEFYRRKASDSGITEFLTKPCDDAVLLEKIRSLARI